MSDWRLRTDWQRTDYPDGSFSLHDEAATQRLLRRQEQWYARVWHPQPLVRWFWRKTLWWWS